MKKIIPLVLIILISYFIISQQVEETLKIKEDDIRIRVVPNSNNKQDQIIKTNIKNKLQTNMYNILKEKKTTEEADKTIKKNLKTIENMVQEQMVNVPYSYKLNYGYNYFPKKEYKGVTYEEGNYKSLVVTLGKGEGDNWWCVLFPPLCLIESDTEKEVEYKSLVEELVKKYFK